MVDLLGKALGGRYRLVAKLGRGGMAEVYKAYHPDLDRYVAIKVLHSHLVDDMDFVSRLEREALTVAKLRHPNIVQVFDFGSESGTYYIVMEYVDGPTLKAETQARQATDQPFALEDIGRIFTALCSAIDYAHARGMVHRDLKPANVMINEEGQLLLMDFGLAYMYSGNQITQSGAITGTPAYMAPEQGQGERGDQRSDIYALGIMLYEMITGAVPYDADTPFAVIMKHISEPLPRLTQVNPNAPQAVEDVVAKAMAKDPDDRFQTAGDMAQALREAVGLASGDNLSSSPFKPLAPGPQVEEIEPDTGPVRLEERVIHKDIPNSKSIVDEKTTAVLTTSDNEHSTGGISWPTIVFVNVIALLLIGGAIIVFFSSSGEAAPAGVLNPALTWTASNWPWLILVAVAAIVVVANRQTVVRAWRNLGGPRRRSTRFPAGREWPGEGLRLPTRPRYKAEKTWGGVTFLGNQDDQAEDRHHTSIIFREEIEAVMSSAHDHLIEDWLKLQDSEQIGQVLNTEVNARLLLTGFGSFGGTSLVRGAAARLMDNFAHRQQGKVLVIRLDQQQRSQGGTYELFINENRVGRVRANLTEMGLRPRVEASLTGKANTTGAEEGSNTFQGLTLYFDQGTDDIDLTEQSRIITQFVLHLLRLLNPSGQAVEMDAVLDELFAGKQHDGSRQVILIIDRIDQAGAMARLLDSALADEVSYPWLSLIVVARHEAYKQWPTDLRRQIPEAGFDEHYVRRLWEQDLDLSQELARIIHINYADSEDNNLDLQLLTLWLANLTYTARGSLALAVRKLKKDATLGAIDLAQVLRKERESIEHNAFVQAILEQSWDEILGSLGNDEKQADQARVGIYHLIDWMRTHPIFSRKNLDDAAQDRTVTISDDAVVRQFMVNQLLQVLSKHHYLKPAAGRDGYMLCWKEQETSSLISKMTDLFASRKPRTNGAASNHSPQASPAPAAPAQVQPLILESPPLAPKLVRPLTIALLADVMAGHEDNQALVTQIAFEVLEAKHYLVLADQAGAGQGLRQKLAAYWPMVAGSFQAGEAPIRVVATNGESKAGDGERIIVTANAEQQLQALLDMAQVIILARSAETRTAAFAFDNLTTKAQQAGVPLIPAGAIGGQTTLLWQEISRRLDQHYDQRLSPQTFARLNPDQVFVPDVARSVVHMVEQACGLGTN